MCPLAVALENLSGYSEILSHQPFTEPRGVWSSEEAPFFQACLDQIIDTCSLALASSGSLLLLVLIVLSTTRQEALSTFRKMPYVAMARWKSLKFWKNPPEHLFYLLLTLLHGIRQSSAKAEVIPFDHAERMLLFTGTCVGKRSKLSSHISKGMCNWEEKLPVLWYQIQWTAHTCNKHSISVTLYRKQHNLFHSPASACMCRREGRLSGLQALWRSEVWDTSDGVSPGSVMGCREALASTSPLLTWPWVFICPNFVWLPPSLHTPCPLWAARGAGTCQGRTQSESWDTQPDLWLWSDPVPTNTDIGMLM